MAEKPQPMKSAAVVSVKNNKLQKVLLLVL